MNDPTHMNVRNEHEQPIDTPTSQHIKTQCQMYLVISSCEACTLTASGCGRDPLQPLPTDADHSPCRPLALLLATFFLVIVQVCGVYRCV